MENALYTFSTQPYPARQRFEVWREEVNAIFDINIGEPQSSAFNYRLVTSYLGALLMGCGTWDGVGEPVQYKVKRSSQMIRRDSLDHYYICLGLSHSISGLAGRAPLAAGNSQIYMLDLARELDCVITAGDTIILTIPRDLLTARLGNKDFHGLVLQGGMSDLLADHMRALRHRLPSFDSNDIPHVQQATLAMVSAAIAPSMANLKDAEAEIDRASRLQFLRDTPRNRFLNIEFRQTERIERTENLAGNCRIIKRLCGLLLIGINHDIIHQHARHAHIMRFQRVFLGNAFDLRNNDTAIVARSQRLIQPAEISALMFIGEIAAFIRSCGADDGHMWHDIGEIEPVLTFKTDLFNDRLLTRLVVHRRTLTLGINEGIKPHLGQHARTLGSRLAMHVEQNARRDIIGRNLVIGDHLPDQRRLGARWP